jgi:hypothetical protein
MYNDVDRAKITPRLAQLRETHRIARERLLKILYWTRESATDGMLSPLPKDQVEAAKTLVMLDIAVLKEEVANNVYKTEAEAAAGMRYAPMLPEYRAVVVATFERWGMIPKEQIEQMVPEKLHARITTTHTDAPVAAN